MPYPDLSTTLVKSVKSFHYTWVVAATLIALPKYYHNRFRLSIGHLHDGVILLLTATRVLFVFPFIFRFGNPTEVSMTKA